MVLRGICKTSNCEAYPKSLMLHSSCVHPSTNIEILVCTPHVYYKLTLSNKKEKKCKSKMLNTIHGGTKNKSALLSTVGIRCNEWTTSHMLREVPVQWGNIVLIIIHGICINLQVLHLLVIFSKIFLRIIHWSFVNFLLFLWNIEKH